MKIAIVGAGIFGSTIAIKFAEEDYDVTIFEKNRDILSAASGINQYRLHRGYHYPRSISTALSSKMVEPIFRKEYKKAILENNEHYYCIAKEKSKTSKKQFLEFCNQSGLEYEKVSLDCLNTEAVSLSIKAKEYLINPIALKKIITTRLKKYKTKILCGHIFSHAEVKDFDYVINCSYANLNFILDGSKEGKKKYQFELCEKPILELSSTFKNKSIVVLDGPFMCIDPYSTTNFHVMGNVVHAIHSTNTGYFPIIPEKFLPLLNCGIIKDPKITNIEKFIESATHFMPEIKKARHVGSMYTIRTVLPDVDSTDERPTLVWQLDNKIINVFSGKIGNSIEAAKEVFKIVTAN